MGIIVAIALIGAFLFYAFAKSQEQGRDRQAIQNSMMANGIDPSQQLLARDGSSGIGVDHVARRVRLAHGGFSRALAFKDLLEVEVLEDGQTRTKTRRSSAVGRGILGGLLLGPAGAIVGAISSSSTSTSWDTIRRIDLRLLVAVPGDPVHMMNMLDDSVGVAKDSAAYRDARQKADHWYATLLACIHQADQDDGHTSEVAAAALHVKRSVRCGRAVQTRRSASTWDSHRPRVRGTEGVRAPSNAGTGRRAGRSGCCGTDAEGGLAVQLIS